LGPMRQSFFKRIIGVVYFKGDVAHAIPMFQDMDARSVARRIRRRQQELECALLQRIRTLFAVASLQPRISNSVKAERVAIVIIGLLRITDVKLDVMDLPNFQWIVFHRSLPRYQTPCGTPMGATSWSPYFPNLPMNPCVTAFKYAYDGITNNTGCMSE